MEKHIEYVCLVEQRPFSYLDFLEFNVDGKPHHMTHGTFRNKVSFLIKGGKVEWLCDSPQGFYILKESGQSINTITVDDHTGVNHLNHTNSLVKDKIMNQSSCLVDEVVLGIGSGVTIKNPRIITNNPLYRYVKSVPFGQLSVHDIRLLFEACGIWNKIFTVLSGEINGGDGFEKSNLQGLKIEKRSKDVSFSPVRVDDLCIKVRIHKTDNVSVIIGCSYRPVTLDVEGAQRLSKALSLVQMELTKLVSGMESDVVAREKLDSSRLEEYDSRGSGTASPIIPRFTDWIVTMWHFGADAVHEYSGDKFNCRWELAQNIVASIYSKEWKMSGKASSNTRQFKKSVHKEKESRVRIERQEYPKVSLREALMNKGPEVTEALEK